MSKLITSGYNLPEMTPENVSQFMGIWSEHQKIRDNNRHQEALRDQSFRHGLTLLKFGAFIAGGCWAIGFFAGIFSGSGEISALKKENSSLQSDYRFERGYNRDLSERQAEKNSRELERYRMQDEKRLKRLDAIEGHFSSVDPGNWEKEDLQAQQNSEY